MTNLVRLFHRDSPGASEWARENCASYIAGIVSDSNPPSYYEMTMDHYFEDTVEGQRDAALFILRWA